MKRDPRIVPFSTRISERADAALKWVFENGPKEFKSKADCGAFYLEKALLDALPEKEAVKLQMPAARAAARKVG